MNLEEEELDFNFLYNVVIRQKSLPSSMSKGMRYDFNIAFLYPKILTKSDKSITIWYELYC